MPGSIVEVLGLWSVGNLGEGLIIHSTRTPHDSISSQTRTEMILLGSFTIQSIDMNRLSCIPSSVDRNMTKMTIVSCQRVQL